MEMVVEIMDSMQSLSKEYLIYGAGQKSHRRRKHCFPVARAGITHV